MRSEWKYKCDVCKNKGQSRIFWMPVNVDGKGLKWAYLCPVCWDIVAHRILKGRYKK